MVPSTDSAGLIIDVGVADGNDTAFYLEKGFDVLAVEANPSACNDLKARFADQIGDGRLRLLNLAAGRQFGDNITFYAHRVHKDLSGWEKRGDVPDDYEVHRVTVVDWRTLVAQRGVPRYLKIDIEGAEEAFLAGMADCAERPEFISAECYRFSVCEHLHRLGYERFRLVDQNPPGGFVLPQPQLEGRTLQPREFVRSSGPFGLDLFGDREWLSFDDLVPAYEVARQQFHLTWFDCHVWRPN